MFLNGDCKKKFCFKGDGGDFGRFVIFGGELNEKVIDLFLELFFEGVFLLFGVSGVRRVGLLVWLVFSFLLMFVFGVILDWIKVYIYIMLKMKIVRLDMMKGFFLWV